MKFQEGQSGNPSGRPRGALNNLTKDLKVRITEFLEDSFDEVIEEWKKQKGKNKLQFWRDLLPFVVPRLRSIEETTDFNNLTDEQLDRIIDELKGIAYGQITES